MLHLHTMSLITTSLSLYTAAIATPVRVGGSTACCSAETAQTLHTLSSNLCSVRQSYRYPADVGIVEPRRVLRVLGSESRQTLDSQTCRVRQDGLFHRSRKHTLRLVEPILLQPVIDKPIPCALAGVDHTI